MGKIELKICMGTMCYVMGGAEPESRDRLPAARRKGTNPNQLLSVPGDVQRRRGTALRTGQRPHDSPRKHGGTHTNIKGRIAQCFMTIMQCSPNVSLLIRLVTLLKENNLVDGVRYIPVEMRPRDKKNSCCVHKDRYIIRHKIISILGFDIRNEEDIDLVPLSHYAQKSLDNKNMKEDILSVVHEACNACMQSQYFITNMCRGCEARPCMMNCPKSAISFKGGKATISQEDCVSLRTLSAGMSLPRHHLYARPVRRGVPRQGHLQTAGRYGTYRQGEVHLLRQVYAGMSLRSHHGTFQNHRRPQMSCRPEQEDNSHRRTGHQRPVRRLAGTNTRRHQAHRIRRRGGSCARRGGYFP